MLKITENSKNFRGCAPGPLGLLCSTDNPAALCSTLRVLNPLYYDANILGKNITALPLNNYGPCAYGVIQWVNEILLV